VFTKPIHATTARLKLASRLLALCMTSLRVVALLLMFVVGEVRAAPPLATVAVDGAKIPDVGFDVLAGFPFQIVDAGTGASPSDIAAAQKKDQVPAHIRRLDGTRIAVTGYMLPLQLEQGRARKLVLMRDVMTCCYGATPNMNDYIVVTVKGDGVPPLADIPVVFVGTLHVAATYENGYLVSLYTLETDKYLGPRK
jgi:hypothetical protein